MKLKVDVICAVAVVASLLAVSMAQIRTPPSISIPPEDQIYKDTNAVVEMVCEAEGSDPIQYQWNKDGAFFDLNRPNIVVDDITKGTFKFIQPSAWDFGIYQCIAENPHGVTMSDNAELVFATVGTYPTVPEKTYEAVSYEPLTLQCQQIKSVPPPTYAWVIAKSSVDSSPVQVVTSDRVNIDEEGNLHFAHIMPEDDRGDLLYKCVVYNAVKDISVGGSYSKISVTDPGRPEPAPAPPVLVYQNDVTVAILTQSVILRCLFSGYPTIISSEDIVWTVGGAAINPRRMHMENFRTTLVIDDVHWEDENTYICSARSNGQTTEGRFEIDVREIPNFVSETSKPVDQTYTNGETAEFHCEANGEPEPDKQWFINGVAVGPANLPPRMYLSDNHETLQLTEVCKICPGGSSDLQVLQCNASNEHGYTFSSGYLNVLEPTSIVEPPEDMELIYYKPFMFNCSAESDPGSNIKYSWTFDDKFQIFPSEGEIELLDGGKTLRIITADTQDGGLSSVGMYKCLADNSYSSDYAGANLTRPVVEPPKPTAIIGTASISDLWWVFLIVACVVLLIILILACILCIQRNKGETYPVDEKERWNGNDPEKELIDSGFQDYQRPEDGPLKGSQASLTSTIKMDSDEEGSLAEYGDLDAGKFNEDGSFIGQYATDKKKAAKGSSETNV